MSERSIVHNTLEFSNSIPRSGNPKPGFRKLLQHALPCAQDFTVALVSFASSNPPEHNGGRTLLRIWRGSIQRLTEAEVNSPMRNSAAGWVTAEESHPRVVAIA